MIESPNSFYRCTAVYRCVPLCTALYRSTVQLYRSVPLCTAQRYTTEIFGGQNWWAARSLLASGEIDTAKSQNSDFFWYQVVLSHLAPGPSDLIPGPSDFTLGLSKPELVPSGAK